MASTSVGFVARWRQGRSGSSGMTRVTDIIERTKRREEEERRRGEAELIHHRAFSDAYRRTKSANFADLVFGLKRLRSAPGPGPDLLPNQAAQLKRQHEAAVLLLPSGTSVKAADNLRRVVWDLLLQARLVSGDCRSPPTNQRRQSVSPGATIMTPKEKQREAKPMSPKPPRPSALRHTRRASSASRETRWRACADTKDHRRDHGPDAHLSVRRGLRLDQQTHRARQDIF